MARRAFRVLVIDASVARAAGGEEATHPTSKHCRDLLTKVYKICHHALLSPALSVEWKQHRSDFARKWQVLMYGKKKIERLAAVGDDQLRRDIENAACGLRQRRVMKKDAHLLEAALAADRVVISLDDKAATAFAGLAKRVRRIQGVMWINPTKEPRQVIEWLRQGAPLRKKNTLSRFADEGERP